ncbi:transglycosylase SLT domain-containing protein [Nocardiopsis dassonvillei]|uniref:aggregation-promoting factor C-terminal-like domain-containing protein n=1 Tax=Nocardiopsis dassonvillei TaxID=2014 RepID=UPI0010D24FA6|nr:transglycosylase SLT domain-containing protein [Nocardiopsis dassonvillei]MCP3015998.1 transglycosylase SLT domain-containing protein [Nocardiopsis dassonvillei]
MSLRSTAAVGAATLVAGATFAVTAFADDELDPDTVASAAIPETEEPAADTEAGEEPFFSEQLSQEELQTLRSQAQEQRDAALTEGVLRAQVEGSDIEEEEEEEEEEETPVFTGDPKGIALQMVTDQGWAASEFHDCLEPLWQKESNWNPSAQNPSSGAYGIPQSLPGDKMATHGDDWQTNPATQIAWGIDYIKGRYGTPCEAWAHSQSVGWY